MVLSVLVGNHCSLNCLSLFILMKVRVVCLCKDKNLGSKYRITHNVVKEAYPDVEWGGRR